MSNPVSPKVQTVQDFTAPSCSESSDKPSVEPSQGSTRSSRTVLPVDAPVTTFPSEPDTTVRRMSSRSHSNYSSKVISLATRVEELQSELDESHEIQKKMLRQLENMKQNMSFLNELWRLASQAIETNKPATTLINWAFASKATNLTISPPINDDSAGSSNQPVSNTTTPVEAQLAELRGENDVISQALDATHEKARELGALFGIDSGDLEQIKTMISAKLERLTQAEAESQAQKAEIDALKLALEEAKQLAGSSNTLSQMLVNTAYSIVELMSQLTQNTDTPLHMTLELAGRLESVTIWPANRSDDGRVMDRLTARAHELFGEGCKPEDLPDKVIELEEQLKQLKETVQPSEIPKNPEASSRKRKRTNPRQITPEDLLLKSNQKLAELKEANLELTKTVHQHEASFKIWSNDAKRAEKETADLRKKIAELEYQLAQKEQPAELVIEGHHLIEARSDEHQAVFFDQSPRFPDDSGKRYLHNRSCEVTIDPDQMTALLESAPESASIKLANNFLRSGRLSQQTLLYGVKTKVGQIEPGKKVKKEPAEQTEKKSPSPAKTSGKGKSKAGEPPAKRKKLMTSKAIKSKTDQSKTTKAKATSQKATLQQDQSLSKRRRR